MSIKSHNLAQKEKIGTVLNKNTILKIKERAVKEGKTISDVIEEAIAKYDEFNILQNDIRKKAVLNFCSRPFNISDSELNDILKEDFYE